MVTFETKVWEKDWKYILTGDYLDKVIERCHYPFKEKTLIINNVSDKRKVGKLAEEKVRKGVLDSYYFADEYADKALASFNIDLDSFKGGYNYSIAELVSIYLCKTEYLLHFSSDALLPNDSIDWIDDAIKVLETRKDIIVANPTWNYAFDQAKNESIDETDQFYIGYGFSDQCFLVKTDVFKQDVYNEKCKASERYPDYGGELFEKRVDSFMRNRHLLRITSKNKSYIHKNFPKKNLLNKLDILARCYTQYRLFHYKESHYR